MHYVLVNPQTGTVDLLNKECFIVPVDENDARKDEYSREDFLNAADDTRFTIIPVIETLEWDDSAEEALVVETGLPEGSTWEAVAWAYRGLWYDETGDDPSENI